MHRAVVIPHRSRRDLLSVAVASVTGEVVFVVDDSDAESLDGDSLGSDVRIVPGGGGMGFARAVNRGLAAAEASGFTHALILNDDAAPEPGALDALCAAWTSGSGAVGPLLVGPEGIESAGMRLSRWGRLQNHTDVPPGGRPVDVDAISGACMLVRAGTRFDEGYTHGMEDVSLCRALRRAGRSVRIVPTVRCRHTGGATVDRRSSRAQRHAVAGHLRLVGGGVRTPIVLGLAVAQVLREGGPRDRLRAVGQGWWDWHRAH
ncbi:MAG: glycosyltransferase family 2 protein [Myxococcota bacterium]|nr:glycosyltransferase family 2 protein [Myxococcota bacterium]MEC8424624.1 glycosyltransferase family 2 protein [Myxococcota bacterium]